MTDLAALLHRDEARVEPDMLRDSIEGRRVLITGAGGSIGSELARQVYALHPSRLALVDRAEGPLYDIGQELALRNGSAAILGDHLANVANLTAMMDVVQSERPDIILHAAAYKHVPMMERHPADAVYTNLGGTLAMVRAAMAHNVDRFVLVSTDKAVEPTSVMGASKRLAELVVASVEGRYVSVRFGNVLGSSGSIVPLLRRQIAEGVALTLTDTTMTRYLITVQEAAQLILVAAAVGGPHDILALDMGQPVRLGDLAEDVLRQAGEDPDTYPVRMIGLRRGEKRHESLTYPAEHLTPTEHPRVRRIAQPRRQALQLDALIAIAESGDHDRTRTALWATMDRLS